MSLLKNFVLATVCVAGIFTQGKAQEKKSGAIQFQSVFDPAAMAAASGMQLSEEQKARMPQKQTSNFELLFTPAKASYMAVEELEDSNGGGGNRGFGGMMMRFGGMGGNRSYYYDLSTMALSEVVEVNDTTYIMPGTLGAPVQMPSFGGANSNRPSATPPVTQITRSDETKKILGFDCKKYTIKTIRKVNFMGQEREVTDETHVWYTKDLGFNFSPNPAIWQDGAVLAIEGRGNSIVAKSIEYRRVADRDVMPPKKVTQITQQEYRTKMENMMRRFRNNGNRTQMRIQN